MHHLHGTGILRTHKVTSHIDCKQIARFYCVSLSQRDVKFGPHLTFFQNLKASLRSSTRALFYEKARCFSQSERALYGNFTAKYGVQIQAKATVVYCKTWYDCIAAYYG